MCLVCLIWCCCCYCLVGLVFVVSYWFAYGWWLLGFDFLHFGCCVLVGWAGCGFVSSAFVVGRYVGYWSVLLLIWYLLWFCLCCGLSASDSVGLMLVFACALHV